MLLMYSYQYNMLFIRIGMYMCEVAHKPKSLICEVISPFLLGLGQVRISTIWRWYLVSLCNIEKFSCNVIRCSINKSAKKFTYIALMANSRKSEGRGLHDVWRDLESANPSQLEIYPVQR